MTFFRIKFPFSRPKFLLVIGQDFSDFPFLFPDIFCIFTVLNRLSYMTLSSQEKPLFTRKHTISYFRAHPTTLAYFSKYWGDGCMGRPPPEPSNFGGPSPSPPRSLPLDHPITITSVECSIWLNCPGLSLWIPTRLTDFINVY